MIQAPYCQWHTLEANVQGLKKRHSPLNEVDHRTESPFKAPSLAVYTGKEDPMRHVGQFEDQMELLGVSGDYRCRVFLTTLSNTTQEWYWKFKPGSIESWENCRKEFCRQFSTSHTPPVYANNLAEGKEESLSE